MIDAADRKVASGRIAELTRRRGAGTASLALHAALPAVLDPELLHLIRINFFSEGPDALPFTAEADVLLSSLFVDIGGGLFEMAPTVRAVLLEDLAHQYGPARLREVALLLFRYTERRHPWASRPRLERAQQLTALGFLSPPRAREWIARAKTDSGQFPEEGREWFTAMSRELEQISPSLTETTRVDKPLQWIVIVGTGATFGLDKRRRRACVEVGHALALTGYGLITGDYDGVDLVTATAFAEKLRPDQPLATRLVHLVSESHRKSRFPGATIERTKSPHEAMIASVTRAAAMVLIGGGREAVQLVMMAKQLGLPVFPIGFTGGAAAQIQHEMRFDPTAWSWGWLERVDLDALGNENAFRADQLMEMIARALDGHRLNAVLTLAGVKKLPNEAEKLAPPEREHPIEKLSGAELRLFREALISAFPTWSALAMMFAVQLDQRLELIVAPGSLSNTVFHLITWAEAQGKLDALLAGALEANPGNRELNAFVKGLASSRPSASTITPSDTVEVLILTTLDIEREAVISALGAHQLVDDGSSPRHYEANLVSWYGYPGHYAVIAQAHGMGSGEGALLATQLTEHFNPRLVLFVGTCSGVGDKVALGDVVVADAIAESRRSGLVHESAVHLLDRTLLKNVVEVSRQDWSRNIGARPGPGAGAGAPSVHVGGVLLTSGWVQTATLVKLYQSRLHALVGIEMEGGGIPGVLLDQSKSRRFFMIHGVADLASEPRSKDDSWQVYAGHAAAAFTVALLRDAAKGPSFTQPPPD